MRHKALAFAAVLGGLMAFGAPVLAADTPYEVENTSEKPLMIIRFNQPHLQYDKQLYSVVSRALEVKPSAIFDIVSVAPRAPSSGDQESYNRIAAQNTHKVIASLEQMGLPQSRINLTNAQDNVGASEVRIFVH